MNTLFSLDPAGVAWRPGWLTHRWQATVVAAGGLPARIRLALAWIAQLRFAVSVNRIANAVARPGRAATRVAATAVLVLSGRVVAVAGQAPKTEPTTDVAAGAAGTDASASRPAKPRWVVGEVAITGDAATAEMRRATQTAALLQRGGPFDAAALDRSLRALYATGQFESIEARTRLVDGSKVDVTYVVRLKGATRAGAIPGGPEPGDTFEIGSAKAPAELAAEALAEAQRTVATAQAELAKLREARAVEVARQQALDDAAAMARVAAAPPAEAAVPGAQERAAAARIITAPAPVRTGYTAPVVPPSSLDRQPVPRFQARPRYPFQLRKNGVAGEAVVDFVVDAEGKVVEPVAVRMTHEDFGAAAVDAVRRWQFQPGVKDGRAVATQLQVPIVFTLNEN